MSVSTHPERLLIIGGDLPISSPRGDFRHRFAGRGRATPRGGYSPRARRRHQRHRYHNHMIPEDFVIVLSTAPDAGTAERLARSLVEESLAACVNRLPGIRSIL